MVKAAITANRGYNPLVQGMGGILASCACSRGVQPPRTRELLVFFFAAEGEADKYDAHAEHAAEEGGDDAD